MGEVELRTESEKGLLSSPQVEAEVFGAASGSLGKSLPESEPAGHEPTTLVPPEACRAFPFGC
jgi:hypothetical protein